MSREIKFRVNTYKGIVYGRLESLATLYPDIDSGWMQYTGLKDRHGKEIYEGDIVVASWIDGAGFGAVEWSENNCLFGIHIGDVYEGLNGLTGIEVIGNIYEHGYLLENESKEV